MTRSGLSGISFALFTPVEKQWQVVACRSPRTLFDIGSDLRRIFAFSKDDMHFLFNGVVENRIVRTKRGVGILSRRFLSDTGIGLYIHFHTEPLATAYLFSSYTVKGFHEVSDAVKHTDGSSENSAAVLWNSGFSAMWEWVAVPLQHISVYKY